MQIQSKGYQCQISGQKYEIEVYNIVKKCDIIYDTFIGGESRSEVLRNGNNKKNPLKKKEMRLKKFNTQREEDLGCSNSNADRMSKNDLLCNYRGIEDIAIEIKKEKTPDWVQCSLKYDKVLIKWLSSTTNHNIPNKCKQIYEELLNGIELFGGHIPPFFERKMTYDEWNKIKKESGYYADMYIDCPDNIINRLYREKGCQYIQISNRGLYHLGEDICQFGVPEFQCKQQLRIRIKTHKKEDRKGKCQLSVIVSCMPKNIKQLVKSNYSLDTIQRLPDNLIYFAE
jgi:hypothetical protein